MAAPLALSLAVIALLSAATNITKIFSAFPEYNDFLSKTKLSDKINSRESVTVCVLPNGALSTGKHPLSVVKNILALHVLFSYFDVPKLYKISEGSILSTTLYQTTSNADGKLGFVNITDVKGGKVAFGSGVASSLLDATFSKSVKQFPYNLSVIEIPRPSPHLPFSQCRQGLRRTFRGYEEAMSGTSLTERLISDSGSPSICGGQRR